MRHIIKHLLVILPFIIFFSCSTEPEKEYIYYLVNVDSIKHPQSVSLNDTITFKLYGTVGSDGCHSFSHFESLTGPFEVDLKVWGKVSSLGSACPAVMVYLEGKEYKVAAKERGIYSIKIHQPDGSVLKDSVIIR